MNNKIDWKRKLSSRKLWALLAALVLASGALFGLPESAATQVAALITALGAVVAYILGESSVDAANAASNTTNIVETTTTEK